MLADARRLGSRLHGVSWRRRGASIKSAVSVEQSGRRGLSLRCRDHTEGLRNQEKPQSFHSQEQSASLAFFGTLPFASKRYLSPRSRERWPVDSVVFAKQPLTLASSAPFSVVVWALRAPKRRNTGAPWTCSSNHVCRRLHVVMIRCPFTCLQSVIGAHSFT